MDRRFRVYHGAFFVWAVVVTGMVRRLVPLYLSASVPIVMSRNHPDVYLRVSNSIKHYGRLVLGGSDVWQSARRNLSETRIEVETTRNARLAAIRSLFRLVALREPARLDLAAQVLAIPTKRADRRLIGYLTRPEMDAILATPSTQTWIGKRDYALLLTLYNTGARISEILSLRQHQLAFGATSLLHLKGKGRKERSVPLWPTTSRTLRTWVTECGDSGDRILFPRLDLAAAVPAVANWSMSSIPRAIPADQVRQLLASIDRGTPAGCRDYAILLLLARLGLRSGEVASLELDNIDWNVGQLSVRGKSGQRTELPLSAEVGEAITTYLRRGRPQSASRRVFLRVKAPIRGFRGASGVGSIVHHRLQRAGIDAPTHGAHQFRHGLATQMLRQGASLDEIGEVLGHHNPQTTTIYTKVDLDALRTLALPWPGGVR